MEEPIIISNADKKKEIKERYKGVDKSILKVIPALETSGKRKTLKKVAVYARVSTDHIGQTSSYELQKNYYTDLVRNHQGWHLVEMYADEGFSATSMRKRGNFNRMLADCEAGKIDIIITKSIARFSRNVVDCIKTIRWLKFLPHPVEVIFEIEDIHTFDASTEMKLSFLSAVAQEESHNKSIAITAALEQRFSRGIFLGNRLYGFDIDKDLNFTIDEEKAEIVRLCFYMRILGYGIMETADFLNRHNIKGITEGCNWQFSQIARLLENEKYCGDFLARKTYIDTFLGGKKRKNNNNRNMYFQKNHHQGIVSKEVYRAANYLLHNCNHTRKSRLIPELRAVNKGILRGYVPMNFAYNSFPFEDCLAASIYGYDGPLEAKDLPKMPYKKKARKFAVPTIVVRGTQFVFNWVCFKFWQDVEYAEILVNFQTAKIAIRPADKNLVNTVMWVRRNIQGSYHISMKAEVFCKHLYKLIGSDNLKDKYIIPGEFLENAGQKLMIFDLKQAIPNMDARSIAGCELHCCYQDKYNAEQDLEQSDYYAPSILVPNKQIFSEEELDKIKADTLRILAKLGIKENLWIE